MISAHESETAMITGAHTIIYSTSPEADRAFFRDVLRLPNVDVGGGWLIFGLPPAEVAVHPSDNNDVHELYLMCNDIESLVVELAKRDIPCGQVQDQGWGLLAELTLPGGGKMGVYQPRHARPDTVDLPKPRKGAKKAAKKAAKRTNKRAKTRRTAKSRQRR